MAGQARQQATATPAPREVAPAVSRRAGEQSRRGNGFLAEQLARRNADAHAEGAGGTAREAEVQPPAPVAGQQASGSIAAPLKVARPAPAVAGEQRRASLGVQIIGVNVSPSALDACEAFVALTLGHRPDIQERMEQARVALVIIPRSGKMTDVPQFASLKGKKTFDGRVWDDVRGAGGMRVSGGLWAIAVPEENLVETGGEDGYGAGYSVGLHELSHSVHSKGLGRNERERITALYAERKRAGGPWTESYGASNEQEYFAQSTNCFFSQNAGIGENDPQWLREHDRPMFDFLVSVYGAPPARAVAALGADSADA